MKAVVPTDACDDYKQQYYKYYCVISNERGSVTSDVVTIKAQHVFGRYRSKDSETHENYCFGECSAMKEVSKHRFTEWTLVRPATSTETGLREQTCLDCQYKNTEVIPKVEPGHVHSYDIAKYSITQHWFVCKCGISSPEPPQDHNFDETEVITEPTVKKTGENKLICSACGFSKTEKTDKLPHTEHEWYAWNDPDMFIWGANGRLVPDPNMGSRGIESHTVKCQLCNEKKTDKHVWPMWECTRDAKISGSDTIPGKLLRYCEECGYEQIQYFPYGSWPIRVEGGTAYDITIKNGRIVRSKQVAYAKKGETIFLAYDPKAAQAKLSFNNVPVKFKQWVDGTGYTGETNIPWDNGRSDIDLPRLTFRLNRTAGLYAFTMPDGPAVAFALTEECDHTGGTKQSKRVEATCSSHGHEPNTLCKDCETVLEEGARIPALGHDLPDTPIAGTEVVEYCTIWVNDGYRYGKPNTATHGWSGDFLCNRCNETVKGKPTPLRHGKHDKNNQYIRPGMVWTDYYKWVACPNPPTCTKAGYYNDLYCQYCEKLVEKAPREEALGHEWGEWETIREATATVKGMERRICERDETHVETRLTDYSGPDYRLKPNKTRLRFEWTYGQQPPTQTIDLKSIGRDSIVAITYAIEENVIAEVSFDGFTLNITPKDITTDYESPMAFDLITRSADGETVYLNIPDLTMTCHVKKTEEKYTLTVEDGVATTGTLVGNNFVLDTNCGNKLQVRGGVPIRLEPDDEWRKDFIHWEVVEDASNFLRDIFDLERIGGWGPSSSPTYGNRWTHMSANDVTVRAIYKKNVPTMAFTKTEVTARMDADMPKLRTSPGNLPVTYSSSDESVAKVNAQTGAISFMKAGIVTITAAYAGNTHYLPATATYSLKIPQDFIDGIAEIDAHNNVNLDEKTYNLSGQRVGKGYKGIVVTARKKHLKK